MQLQGVGKQVINHIYFLEAARRNSKSLDLCE